MPGVKRWLALHRVWPCLFGLRCARIVSKTKEPLPPGVYVQAEYTCAGCGSRYRGDGWNRERIA